MFIKEVTYSISIVVPHPTKQFENMKPLISMTAVLDPFDDLEAAKTSLKTSLKKAISEFSADCVAKMSR